MSFTWVSLKSNMNSISSAQHQRSCRMDYNVGLAWCQQAISMQTLQHYCWLSSWAAGGPADNCWHSGSVLSESKLTPGAPIRGADSDTALQLGRWQHSVTANHGWQRCIADRLHLQIIVLCTNICSSQHCPCVLRKPRL